MTPLVSWIQKNGLVIMGKTIYAQQVVTLIGLILVAIAILYLNKKMIKTDGK